MGNGGSKDPNEGRTVIKFFQYNIRQPALQLPKKMNGRISSNMWSEFQDAGMRATRSVDAQAARHQEQLAICYFFGAFFTILIGGAFGGVAGGVGGSSGNYGLMISGIILGPAIFIAGIVLFFKSSMKLQNTQRKFFNDNIAALQEEMRKLNGKYQNMITFQVHVPSQPTNGNNPNIYIDFKLLVQNVEHIPDYAQQQQQQHRQIIMQQPAQQPMVMLQQQQAQPQVVMVKMPDGRMVPAQIMGPVQSQHIQQQQQYPIQQMQIQHGMNQYSPVQPSSPQVHSPVEQLPPAYNPNMNDVEVGEEEQNEGGVTNDGHQYQ